jgi:hypothetical protein
MIAGDAECDWISGTVDGIAAEHPAEEQYLGSQKKPHPEGGRVLLLIDVVELVPER